MLGETISHYRILRKLGQGGMGEVYLARDARLHRDVAMKVMSHQALTPEGRVRFRREALALSRLNHPNVATIHDVGEENGIDFLVMEYVEGIALDERVRQGPFDTAELLDLGRQLAEGLAAAHAKGLIHRDLKPANLKVTPEGRLKILDFGLARLDAKPTDSTIAGTELMTRGMIGTVPYMAPEQIGGTETDPRTDVYGACAVLYELATGKRPHHEAVGPALMSAILGIRPSSPKRMRPGLPEGLDALIMKGLEKEPRARYSSGAELAEEFRNLQSGGMTHAAKARRRKKRSRALTIAVPGLALILVVASDVGGIRTSTFRWLGFGPSQIRSLVVLPMEDVSPNPNSELQLGAALTFELTTTLQRISSIARVISPRTAQQFTGSEMDPGEIARELGVDGVVDASFQISDEEVRLQVSLVEASTGAAIWAQGFQRDLDDLLGLQNQLAATIAAQIGAALSPQESATLGRDRRVDPRAFQAFESAVNLMYIGNDYQVELAVEKLQDVARMAPEWAEAHAYLALACAWAWGFRGEDRQLIADGKAALTEALRIDPDLAVAHTARASQEFWYNFDSNAAREALSRAKELDPMNPVLAMYESIFWSFVGEFDRAIAVGRRALELDPLNPVTSRSLAWSYYTAGRWQDALAQHDATREILSRVSEDPTNEALSTEKQTTWNLVCLGRTEEAWRISEENGLAFGLMDSCEIMLAEGDSSFVADALKRPGWDDDAWSRDIGSVLLARMGDQEPVFALIEEYYRERNPRLWWVMLEPFMPDLVIRDPRWNEWRDRLGFRV